MRLASNRSLRGWLAVAFAVSTAAWAGSADVFHGWSKDASWLVYESAQRDDRVALFFCKTEKGKNPNWPAELNEGELMNDRLAECVRFIDPNKAPYLWKKLLLLPEVSARLGKSTVKSELVLDGENPGLVIETPAGLQFCYVSALKETSAIEKVWWHPSSRAVAAVVDGRLTSCVLAAAPTQPKTKAARNGTPPKANRRK